METACTPVARVSLPDEVAQGVLRLIEQTGLKAGDRMPAMAELARRFQVGHLTMREALKKLEVVGAVQIRHGSGIFVADTRQALFVCNPVSPELPTKKMMLDLIEARLPVEVTAVRLAALHRTDEHLGHMASLLDRAEAAIDDDAALKPVNLAFHREIAAASGNRVIRDILDVMYKVYQREQSLFLNIYDARERDHGEHRSIFEAIASGDADAASARMQVHLEGIREAVDRWNPS